MESHGALKRPTSTLHQNLYYYQHSAATQQALVVVVQMACKCVSAYLDERARAHAFSLLLWLGWSLNAYYSTFGVCVWVCVRRVMCFVVCGWWMLLFLFASNRLWLLLFTLSQGFFFSVLFASMWVNKTHCFGGFARWGGTHTHKVALVWGSECQFVSMFLVRFVKRGNAWKVGVGFSFCYKRREKRY